jgi:hypothetical protein
MAQGLVEYGMIVAAVAFVGMVGLQLVGRAEEAVLRGEPLASAPPAPGFFLHPTKTTIPGACGGITDYYVGQQINCAAVVLDQSTTAPNWPQGQVELLLDGTQVATCTLAQLSAVSSTCPLSHPVVQGDVGGGHTLVAHYFNQTSNHQTSSSAPPITFNVWPSLDFAFVCQDPWTGANFKVEVGLPLICTLTVTDKNTGLPYPNVPVMVSTESHPGFAYITCFTAETVSNPGGTYANMSDPTCVPQPAQPQATYTCITLADGTCARVGQGKFVYRRNYNDLGSIAPNDKLTALAWNQSGVSPSITIVPNAIKHSTVTIVNCSTNVNVPPGTELARGAPMLSDVGLFGTAPMSFNCTASVTDANPNTAFDWFGGTPQCVPGPLACNINDETPHAPLGTVLFNIKPSGGVDSVLGTCQLSHLPPPPSYLAPHPWGTWFYASWCKALDPVTNLPPVIPPGSWTVHAAYQGSSSHNDGGAVGSQDSLAIQVTVN